MWLWQINGPRKFDPFDCSFALTSFDIVLLRNGNTSKYSKSVSLLTWWTRTNINNATRTSRWNQVVVPAQFISFHHISPDSTLRSTLRVVFHFRMFPMLQVCKPGFWLAASSYASVRNPAPQKMPPQCGPGSNHWLCVHQNDSVLDMVSKDIHNTDFILFLISLCHRNLHGKHELHKNLQPAPSMCTILSPFHLTCRVESFA